MPANKPASKWSPVADDRCPDDPRARPSGNEGVTILPFQLAATDSPNKGTLRRNETKANVGMPAANKHIAMLNAALLPPVALRPLLFIACGPTKAGTWPPKNTTSWTVPRDMRKSEEMTFFLGESVKAASGQGHHFGGGHDRSQERSVRLTLCAGNCKQSFCLGRSG